MNTNFVLFTIDSGTYGIDISNIISIEKVSETTPTPQMPDYMVGIINIREQVMPIIDCKKLLFSQSSDINENTRYILIETKHTTIALMVESTNEIINFDTSLIKPVHLLGSSNQTYLEGVVLLEDRIISIINTTELTAAIEDLKNIQA
ncbi:chemotaxis protein CheW [Anaerobacillus sp. CMMVII]|uniref:chemotaxis protein CheW n=1 Tax=Anaerobacillus sp. CMMVII TaxID=2755588 RepID=UPI0021B800F1|nr:chemotaxis protein CheW [Anaerobacillus sp. CMMVII]MCT8138088.1 chemotaxis protein CheW [Anaerobacillus sp. CMMVII]